MNKRAGKKLSRADMKKYQAWCGDESRAKVVYSGREFSSPKVMSNGVVEVGESWLNYYFVDMGRLFRTVDCRKTKYVRACVGEEVRYKLIRSAATMPAGCRGEYCHIGVVAVFGGGDSKYPALIETLSQTVVRVQRRVHLGSGSPRTAGYIVLREFEGWMADNC